MHESRFFTFFPVPEFLRMPAVGFDISDHAIRILEAVPSPSGMCIGRYGAYPLPKNMIQGGVIQDMSALVEAVRMMAKKYSVFYMRASLPAEQAYFFTHELQGDDISPEAIRNEIEFKLEEHIPIAPADALFDYTLLTPAAGRRREVSVVTFPKKIAASYEELFEQAGVVPLSFEVEAEAIARALVRSQNVEPVMIVDFGELKTGVSITSRGAVQFSTMLDFGSSHLTATLQKVLAVSFEEAERVKKEHGFAQTEARDNVTEALAGPISALKDEVRRYVEFWNTHAGESGQGPVSLVALCGGGSNLRGLAEYLELSLRVSTVRANAWHNWFSLEEYIPEISFEESLSYVTAAGLAMRS